MLDLLSNYIVHVWELREAGHAQPGLLYLACKSISLSLCVLPRFLPLCATR